MPEVERNVLVDVPLGDLTYEEDDQRNITYYEYDRRYGIESAREVKVPSDPHIVEMSFDLGDSLAPCVPI